MHRKNPAPKAAAAVDVPLDVADAVSPTRDEMIGDDWTPPEPTRATLMYQLRSKASYRGSIVDHQRNREFIYHSKLERDFLHIALAREDIEDIQEQPSKVSYRDAAGRLREHVFDSHLVRKDGMRIEVDVKPRSRVEKSGIEETQSLIADQSGSAIADRFVVITEDLLHPADVHDARWILRARRLPDETADRAAADVVGRLHGWCRLEDLVDAVGLGPAGFNAAIRLIAKGVLEVRDGGRIASDCLVRRKLH